MEFYRRHLFEYQLHPVGQVLAGMVLHPFAKAKEALAYYRDFAKAIPDDVNTMGVAHLARW